MSALITQLIVGVGLLLNLPGGPEVEAQRQAGPASIAARYQNAAQRIIKATLAENDAYEKLEELCLDIGHRLAGSPQLEQAIEWAMATMKKDGQENVHSEEVMVPHWVRGRESAALVKPRAMPLHMLGLGGAVATPTGGITAPVVVVADKDEFDALGNAARDKIVLFNNVMPEYDPKRGSGYGTAVQYRMNGARYAADAGAVACLVRSITAHSLRSPHTGMMSYGDAKVKVPAAAISVEDAEMLASFQRRGIPIEVTLKMEAKTLPDAESANVIGELRGSTSPHEVVVIGGHLDSWDVGHGAHDDGAGCVIAMETINVLRKLNMIPRRTIRVVLWTSEENGLYGGRAYAKDHANEMDKHVAAIESDSGIFKPKGYSVQCKDKDREARAAAQMREILGVFSSTFPHLHVATGSSGADVSPMHDAGVVLMGHRVDGSIYFDYHHSHADTIDKIDPQDLSQNLALFATVAYILADMPERIGEASQVHP